LNRSAQPYLNQGRSTNHHKKPCPKEASRRSEKIGRNHASPYKLRASEKRQRERFGKNLETNYQRDSDVMQLPNGRRGNYLSRASFGKYKPSGRGEEGKLRTSLGRLKGDDYSGKTRRSRRQSRSERVKAVRAAEASRGVT